jgi:putative endonuclease
MFYVYILKLVNGDYYIGRSDNLKRRIKDHISGQQKTTKRLLPCKLMCYIAFNTKEKSILFEKYLKSGSGFAFRNRHLTLEDNNGRKTISIS